MTSIFDIPGTNSKNPFTSLITGLVTFSLPSAKPASDQSITHLVSTITASADPTHSFWELWDAFFTSIVKTEALLAPHLALLDLIRKQPPSKPDNVPAGSAGEKQLYRCTKSDGRIHWAELPLFDSQWRDTYDILWAWRDWTGVRPSSGAQQSTDSTLSINSGEYYARFCFFSAALLKASDQENGDVRSIRVFYACRDVLERSGPLSSPSKANRISPEEVWALDIRVTATWLRDGASVLWNTKSDDLRRDWAAALDEKTELWPRGDGLTRDRWQLWRDRLQDLSLESTMAPGTRALLTEAAQEVDSLLVKAHN